MYYIIYIIVYSLIFILKSIIFEINFFFTLLLNSLNPSGKIFSLIFLNPSFVIHFYYHHYHLHYFELFVFP